MVQDQNAHHFGGGRFGWVSNPTKEFPFSFHYCSLIPAAWQIVKSAHLPEMLWYFLVNGWSPSSTLIRLKDEMKNWFKVFISVSKQNYFLKVKHLAIEPWYLSIYDWDKIYINKIIFNEEGKHSNKYKIKLDRKRKPVNLKGRFDGVCKTSFVKEREEIW